MPSVAPVRLTYNPKILWFDPKDLDIHRGDALIVKTERGQEYAIAEEDIKEVDETAIAKLKSPLKPVIRKATDEDARTWRETQAAAADALPVFKEMVAEQGLDMHPVAVEFLFDGDKAVFYFEAEERVDFRELVRTLASRFHKRIDMRQIGVRDETRLVGGYAQCGQELCCTRFGGQFEPVSIRMAKEQDLPLNSSKISGVCGRLMCCLRYEFEAYKDFKSRAPKKKTLIDTPLGKARIQEYDTPREQLVLRLENGKVFKVNLADMTCSGGCKKKAAEQGCNCRPDCVTRDVLERIESPEMRLALMELDRENGVDVGDGLSSADRLAGTTMPKRRRRDADADTRAGQGQGEGRGRGKGRGNAATPEAEEAAGGRRRRKRAGSGDATEAAAAGKNASREREVQQPQQQNRGGGMNPTRRRRRHLSSEEREDAFRAAAAREAGAASKGPSASDAPVDKGGKPRGEEERAPRPRRRHYSGTQQKPSVPSVADQVSDGEVKVTRRRPGDGGGAAAKASRGGTRDEREPREDRGGEGSADQGQKRRRRRRSRKPRQDGGEGSTPSSSAPQPPAGE